MPTPKQLEQLQLAARLAVNICLGSKVELGSADMCNLHELALAGLGYNDPHPQVSMDVIEQHVHGQLGNRLMPVENKE